MAVGNVTGAPPVTAGVDGEIFYARSIDRGATFGEVYNVSGDADMSALGHVAAGGGSVHLVWKQGDDGEVLYRRSPDGGVSFDEAVNLSGTQDDSSEPDVAVSGDDVHVVWAEAFLGDDDQPDPDVDADEAYGRSSFDGGSEFGERHSVSDSRHLHSRDPDIAATGDVVVTVYEEEVADGDDEVFARRSADGGRSWEAPANLSDDAGKQVEPAVAVSGTDVHVVWEDAWEDVDGDRIAYARSTDGGVTFTSAEHLPGETPSEKPSVAADGAAVDVVSCVPADDAGIYDSEVLYHRSEDGGVTWDDPVNLSETTGDCDDPKVVAHDGHVYVAWADSTTGRTDILLRRSRDGGAGFEPLQNVSSSRGNSEDVSLAVDRSTGALFVVWMDFSIDTPPAPPPTEPLGGSEPAQWRAATATMGWGGGLWPREPWKGRSEKLKIPPSAATMR